MCHSVRAVELGQLGPSQTVFSYKVKTQPQPYTTLLIAVINLTDVSVTQGEVCADDLDPSS